MQDKRVLQIKSPEDMIKILKDNGRPFKSFKKGDTIHFWNKMSKGSYVLAEEPGTNLAFEPYVTPGEMLSLGVFGGKYLNDCLLEFPAEWFWNALLLEKLAPQGRDPSINYFNTSSSLSLQEWKDYGWIPGGKKTSILSDPKINQDDRGFFQWYCRYYMGRRIPELDALQIQRWYNFKRHYTSFKKHCIGPMCRPRQRQSLLHWAWKYE